ncbi:hypothetical protein N7U66_12975 [Lacinutrix neustonica]|uniref:Uncharacterized protein n=1 Tax=Lacinutrix neustonica TaxID=2980107 RepID=A0A9E8MU24_9FLAO|nr:hypothetical protein [Lacinutrix neustonica]WAC01081.1 hypothetical protein N7U66_12975 [Lacinutrix neustonica]
MSNNIFSNTLDHQENLRLNLGNLTVFNQDIFQLVNGTTVSIKIQNKSTYKELNGYTTFKIIRLDDIQCLRSNIIKLDSRQKKWCNKILRFLEYRFSSLKQRFKINYANPKERTLFIQNLISLLLEYAYVSKDARFLSLAVKLQRVKEFRNTKNHSVQSSYNILLSKYLIDNF